MAHQSHLTGCFLLFALKFGRWQGPTFCSKRSVASMVLTMLSGVLTQTLLDVKFFFELYALVGGGDAKTF